MMNTTGEKSITVEITVAVPVEKAWNCWTQPNHIVQWNNASDDWHTPRAENDLRKGGSFSSRMEAKDGSVGFDFEGTYDEVVTYRLIAYTLPDKRKVKITFAETGGETKIVETFDPEGLHSLEMQREGWQSILNNFKKHVELKH